MNGRRFLLVAACLLALAPPAFTNEGHQRLLRLDESDRGVLLAALLRQSGEDCPRATRTFFQGRARDGSVFWNAACSNGKAYVVRIADDAGGSTVILNCDVLKVSSEAVCFKTFASQEAKRTAKK
jgi:hypothetical protein